MLSSLSILFLATTAVSIILYCIGFWAALRHTSKRQRSAADHELPPVTLIKPIKGIEEELEENLRSVFEQDYPAAVQLVFSSTESDDPGIALAKKVASRYPNADIAFVLSDASFGLNPKVTNMQGALAPARYDTVLQSDANVRFKPGFLKRLVSEFVTEQASLLSCLVGGVGEKSAFAALENLHLTAYIGPAMCGALKMANTTVVVCKTMIFRRSELESLGGFNLVKDLLLEDFVLGEIYRAAGKKIVLSSTVVENVNVHTPLKSFFKRHSRWLKMTAVISKFGLFGQLITNPLPFALLAWITGGFTPQLALVVVALVILKTFSDAYVVKRMRGYGMRPLYWWLSPVRDLLLASIWIYASFSRTTEWRGKRFRLGPRTRIYPLA
jgi:ceramide glucosyltransferase